MVSAWFAGNRQDLVFVNANPGPPSCQPTRSNIFGWKGGCPCTPLMRLSEVDACIKLAPLKDLTCTSLHTRMVTAVLQATQKKDTHPCAVLTGVWRSFHQQLAVWSSVGIGNIRMPFVNVQKSVIVRLVFYSWCHCACGPESAWFRSLVICWIGV